MLSKIEKVTAFVTLPTSTGGYELLLFDNPAAGIQIPDGTVEADESPDLAVLREGSEETISARLMKCHRRDTDS